MRVDVTNKPNNKDLSIIDLVAATRDVKSDQCVTWSYNLTHKKPKRGPYCLGERMLKRPPCSAYQRLEPGRSFSIPLNFTKAGVVRLIVEANVLSGTAMELTILDAQGREVWRAQSSTRMAGPYAVDLETPGVYELRVANPSSSSKPLVVLLDVTACGDPAVEFWLKRHVERKITEAIREIVQPRRWPDEPRTIHEHGDIHIAPVGIAVYGIKKDGERYSTYKLTTDAAKGVIDISPDVLALSYWEDGTYYGPGLSAQLNAVIAAKIDDGIRYYWTLNVASFGEADVLGEENIIFEEAEIYNNIYNITTITSKLNEFKVKGRNKRIKWNYIYYYGTVPLGHIELETRTRVKNGEIIIEFYVNRRRYDKVVITPRMPATSAHIVAAPATTPAGFPLDLELVLTGINNSIPFTVLKRGRIRLELYVRENGKWVPPPSAWSVGGAIYESFRARVVPQGVGSAIVEPGEPNLEQLWP